MNKRVFWLAIAVGLILVGYFVNRRLGPLAPAGSYALPSLPPPASPSPYAPPPLPPLTIEPLVSAAPRIVLPVSVSQPRLVPMPLVIPIQDGATIDFSIGAPVIRSGGKDTDALDRALREMAEATKNTIFPPIGELPEPSDR